MNPEAPSAADSLLLFKDVTLGYGDFTVLAGIDIDVRRGQVVAMMGGSGSGKTTLLRAATGQILPKQGTVTAFGENIATAEVRIRGKTQPGRTS